MMCLYKGNVIGTDGKPNTEMENKGAILVFEYNTKNNKLIY